MLTKQQAQALAHFAHLCRPDWDEHGIMAQLAKVTHHHPLDVGMALMRLCGDGNVDNPGAFPNPTGPHWTEKVSLDVNTRRPPQKHEECGKHAGEYRLSCRGCAADRKAARAELEERYNANVTRTLEEARAALHAATQAHQAREARQQTTNAPEPEEAT